VNLYDLDTYSFDLPQELIAKTPAKQRDNSSLLVLKRATSELILTNFNQIGQFLPPKALLIGNNSKVLPARLKGRKTTGGEVEFLLLSPLPLLQPQVQANWIVAEAEGLLKASKRPKPGQKVVFGPNFYLIVKQNLEFGRSKVELYAKDSLLEQFIHYGQIPLPPYLKRPVMPEDKRWYQTVYASAEKMGSVAAPTAGLHFSQQLKTKLEEMGFEFAYLTLYVGYGTFSPVRAKDIRQHQMHAEYFEIPEMTAQLINRAKTESRPIIAIGTTSARALEGVFQLKGKIEAFSGWTDIFIYPGFKWQVVDGLITNFHLPKSSLLMLVASFAGLDKIQTAYAYAIQHRLRFFSYGDAMLIL